MYLPCEEIFRKRTVSVDFSACLGTFSSPGHLVEKTYILLVSVELIIH